MNLFIKLKLNEFIAIKIEIKIELIRIISMIKWDVDISEGWPSINVIENKPKRKKKKKKKKEEKLQFELTCWNGKDIFTMEWYTMNNRWCKPARSDHRTGSILCIKHEILSTKRWHVRPSNEQNSLVCHRISVLISEFSRLEPFEYRILIISSHFWLGKKGKILDKKPWKVIRHRISWVIDYY